MDQERPLRTLAGILASGDIPHAFLFTGIDGIGKRSAAMGFAMACNCLSPDAAPSVNIPTHPTTGVVLPFCGVCRICRAIATGIHPDVTEIRPEGDIIKIGRIRELIDRLAFRPHEARVRVVIIEDAGAMNTEAANALLKSLEEPPPRTLFFLTAGHPSDLLPTVVSRCRQVRFVPVSAENIGGLLRHRFAMPADEARAVALLSGGSVAKALTLAEGGSEAESLTACRRWLAGELAALPSRPVPRVLAFAERLQKDRNRVGQWLAMLYGCLYDAVLWQCGRSRVTGADLADDLRKISERATFEALARKLDAVADVEKAVARKLNVRLAMEKMALALADKL
ncbi:MAG: DNA polymerase III subunit delta' [Thermodesulfobacteriota bacterium]